MKVRVPKIKRPPNRFCFYINGDASQYNGHFRCTGAFRATRIGEFFWLSIGEVTLSGGGVDYPCVILERVL